MTALTTPDAPAVTMTSLFECFADDVWRVLRRFGLSTPDADDGLQQVFVIASRRLVDIEQGRERAFLCAVATKVAGRLRQRRQQELSELVEPEEPEAPGAPDEAVERRRLCARLDSLLTTLEPELREVIVLSYCAGLPRREVALALGLPEGTVASRLRRAHALLAASLKWTDRAA